MDKAVHRMATLEREKIQRTIKHKVAGRQRKYDNYLEQDSTGHTTMEGTDRGLRPVVDGQRLSKVKCDHHSDDFLLLSL